MLFQSLFSWMLLWKPTFVRGMGICDIYSFNPCSLGCCSERCEVVVSLCPLAEFQSLFSWMLLWKFGSLQPSSRQNKFQSLFSWMLLWKPYYVKADLRRCLFQSLFSWMLLWKRTRWRWSSSGPGVSILVLLDVALKVPARRHRGSGRSGFNPCSLGCCSESLQTEGFSVLLVLFQSLFSWMLLWKRHYDGWHTISCKFQSLFSWMLLWKPGEKS